MTQQEYRQEAAECVRLAEQSSDPTTKMVSVGLAQAWLQLAHLAEDGGGADDVGDAPPQLVKTVDFVPTRTEQS
jgi:hypothetical protein